MIKFEGLSCCLVVLREKATNMDRKKIYLKVNDKLNLLLLFTGTMLITIGVRVAVERKSAATNPLMSSEAAKVTNE